MIRRVLALLAFAAIAVGAFQPFYLRVLGHDWRQLGAYLTELPYRKVPGLRQLCVEADRRTPVGARILFVAPVPGYEYAFRRAQYLLAGKDVVAGGEADYIACLPACRARGFTTIWSSEKGALLKR
ncbi:MAG TPA: hypothetical protein VF266_25400 [Thermoanaerobaculia bacterium]